MPVCVDVGTSVCQVSAGPWVEWIHQTLKEAKEDVAKNAQGFKFKFVRVFYEVSK